MRGDALCVGIATETFELDDDDFLRKYVVDGGATATHAFGG